MILKKLLFIVLLFCGIQGILKAQLYTELLTDPDFQGQELPFNLDVWVFVQNQGYDTLELKWLVGIDDDCNPNWTFYVADNNNHWLPGITTNWELNPSYGYPSILEPGESYNFILSIVPYNLEGCCQYSVVFSEITNPDNVISEVNMEVKINDPYCLNPVSTKDLYLSSLELSPNPVHDLFRVSNAENINQLVVRNPLGISVYSSRNIRDEHDISHLQNGIYFVSFFDESMEKSRTIKIVKE